MDIKAEDLEDIVLKKEELSDFDPDVLSQELERLSLENNPRDIFERELGNKEVDLSVVKTEPETDETGNCEAKDLSFVNQQKCAINFDILKAYVKNEKTETSITSEKNSFVLLSSAQNTTATIISECPKASGNENVSRCTLAESLDKQHLSDSENEETVSDLRERKPERIRKNSVKRRAQGAFVKPKELCDVSDINKERLRSLSGGQVFSIDESILNQPCYAVASTQLSPIIPEDYSFYGPNNYSISDSGYATSPSSRSDGSSPPLISSPLSPEFFAETLDDKKFIEFASELEVPIASPSESVDDIVDYLKKPPTASPSLENSSFNYQNVTYKPLNDEARKELYKDLDKEVYTIEQGNLYRKISEANEKEVDVIYIEDENEKSSKNRTNLHHAVLQGNKERIFSIIEIHKQFKKPDIRIKEYINIRDKDGKTVLDYAVKNNLPSVVISYLKENLAVPGVHV